MADPIAMRTLGPSFSRNQADAACNPTQPDCLVRTADPLTSLKAAVMQAIIELRRAAAEEAETRLAVAKDPPATALHHETLGGRTSRTRLTH